MKLKVLVRAESVGGYSASVPALPGCHSEGETLEETLANIREAAELCLEVTADAMTGQPPETYRVYMRTIPEEDGGFSTIAINLPGAGSCGDTEEESIANAKEAVQGVLESYQETGDPIPWQPVSEEIGGAKWINGNA
jgi:antitoxin HicB